MAVKQYRSRLHLLAAKEAPKIVILQRKRAKLFHVITVHTGSHSLTEGSWFRGKLYPLRCDISFDGKFMVYLAMGASGKTWNGLCRPPWLTTLLDAENTGTWYGGGYFAGPRLLRSNRWRCAEPQSTRTDTLFKIEAYRSRHGGEDLGVLYERFERDGFTRLGKNWGTPEKLAASTYQVACRGDDGWSSRPSRRHPALQVRYIGYLTHGYTFAFALDGSPELLDGASWATWDSNANLWVARPGVVEKFTLKDLRRGKPSYSLDVDQFEPPLKPQDTPRSAARGAGSSRSCTNLLR